MKGLISLMALSLLAGSAFAQSAEDMAQLTGEDMILATGADLLEVCSADETDTAGLQALSFCYGFIEGVYAMHEAMAATEGGVRLVCPTDGASRDQAADTFVAWAEANPGHLDENPIDALFRAWTEAYPCSGDQ